MATAGPRRVDVLIPTYCRPAALAVTLTGLVGQGFGDFRVVVSDQGDEPAADTGEVSAVLRLLESLGHEPEVHRHLPRRGMAEQRQFLLDQGRGRYALFLDDDILLEPWALGLLVETAERERCGFVGMAPIGLSFRDDVRPGEQAVEFWDGPVRPERIVPRGPEWSRHRLHNAANVWHLQRRLGIAPVTPRTYKLAWVGGCVLYDAASLRGAGGYSFWERLPNEHAGEDVLAQLRVMSRFGGCGVLPSGAYHLELPTTVRDRTVDAPIALGVGE